MSLVRVEGLTKKFMSHGETMVAVDNLDLTLERGEFVCLLGPSGCGKTTTLRSIAGLETPTAGVIDIGGKIVCSPETGTYVPPERRGLGMVFQSYAVWPHMTVAQNVAFPLRHGATPAGKLRRAQIDERVSRILEVMDCAHLAARYPSELSGGQQQRVALARTLVYEPDLLLFDEPLSNLDAKLRERMRLELRELQQRLGFAALYVTHDREEALSLSDRILVMRDGKVVQSGTPEEIYQRPTDVFVADFVGPVNLLPTSALRDHEGCPVALTEIGEVHCVDRAADSADASRASDATSVLIRPGSLTVEPSPGEQGLGGLEVNHWEAEIESATYLGEQILYILRVGETRLTATGAADQRVRSEHVVVSAPPAVCRVVAGTLRESKGVVVDEELQAVGA